MGCETCWMLTFDIPLLEQDDLHHTHASVSCRHVHNISTSEASCKSCHVMMSRCVFMKLLQLSARQQCIRTVQYIPYSVFVRYNIVMYCTSMCTLVHANKNSAHQGGAAAGLSPTEQVLWINYGGRCAVFHTLYDPRVDVVPASSVGFEFAGRAQRALNHAYD